MSNSASRLVPVVLPETEVAGKQHRIEIEPLDAAEMHAGDAQAVTGYPDEPDQSLVAGPRQRLDGAAGSMRRLPLVFFDQIVELDEVDPVDAEACEASLETGPSAGAGPFVRFGGHEEPVAVREPARGRCATRSHRRRRRCRCGSHRTRGACRERHRPGPGAWSRAPPRRTAPWCCDGRSVRTPGARARLWMLSPPPRPRSGPFAGSDPWPVSKVRPGKVADNGGTILTSGRRWHLEVAQSTLRRQTAPWEMS